VVVNSREILKVRNWKREYLDRQLLRRHFKRGPRIEFGLSRHRKRRRRRRRRKEGRRRNILKS
jgi:hypothetical protein